MGPEPSPGPLPPCPAVGWENITASDCLSRGPVLFWGLVLNAAVPLTAIIHNGRNAIAPRVCSATTNPGVLVTILILLPKPILLQNGLYLELTAAPDDCLVLFDPLPSS